MRTKTITINYYTFSELSEQAKKNALESYKKSDLAYRINSEDFEDIQQIEIENFFPHSDVKMQYSFSGCQGDGLNIYGKFALADLIALVENDLTENEKATLYDCVSECPEFNLIRNNRYCYSLWNISYQHDIVNDMISYIDHINEKFADKFADMVCKAVHELCKDWEKWGISYMDMDGFTREDFEELSVANEWEFFADGTLV